MGDLMNYFDLHCDTPYECYKKNQPFYCNNLSVSGKKGEIFDKWTQTFAIWINDNTENPWQIYCNILNDFKEKLKFSPQNLTPLFAVEGGAVLENNINRLEALKQDGIKFLTLTWNGENLIAGGSKTDKGLTNFGKDVIKNMNSLKIGCDLSHINEKSFYSAIEIAELPLATHSNCYVLCPHPRNLKLGQIKLLAEKGGIIGLCFYPDFLQGDVYDAIYRNIYFLCENGFENSIAIGSDFDGGNMNEKLNNICKIPNLYCYLQERNLEKDLLERIFYKNAEKFIAKL